MQEPLTKKNEYIIVTVILIVFTVLSFYFISNFRIFGDAAFHTDFIRSFSSQGKISGVSEHMYGSYGFPRFQLYTLNYPALYHTLGTVLYFDFQSKTLLIIDQIILFALSLFAFSFVKRESGSNYNAIFVLMIILLSGLIVSGGNNNLMIAFFVITSIIYFYNFIKTGNKINLVLFVIFSVAAFGSKQFYIFVYPFVFLLQLFYVFSQKMKLSHFLYINLFIVLLVAPIYYFQIKTTGTISTQTIQGWPLIDSYLKPRHINGLDKWQLDIDKTVDIERLIELSERYYDSINTQAKDIINDFVSTSSRWVNLYNYSLLPLNLRVNILNGVFIVFAMLALLKLLIFRKVDIQKFVFFTFTVILPFVIIMYFTRKIEYALFFPIFFSLFIAISMPKFSVMNMKVILIVFLTLSVMNSYIYIVKVNGFSQNNYLRTSISENEINNMYSWLASNVDDIDIIMTANTQDDPFYSNRKIFYDYRLWFLSEEDLQKYLPYYENFRYIVVFKPAIKDNFDNWVTIPKDSPLLANLQANRTFTKEYESTNFIIYEYNR